MPGGQVTQTKKERSDPTRPRMSDLERYRYRITFEKGEHIRFISHLDLHRSWERTLRRAELPVYHSQGFNPRPKLNLSRALPLGQTSECELMDVWLEQPIEPQELLQRLNEVAPPGLTLRNIVQVPLREDSLQSRIYAATYLVRFETQHSRDQIQGLIDQILAAEELPRTRRKKDYDLRPLIESLEIVSTSAGEITLRMRLMAKEGASGRPEEVLSALGFDPLLARIHRTNIFF